MNYGSFRTEYVLRDAGQLRAGGCTSGKVEERDPWSEGLKDGAPIRVIHDIYHMKTMAVEIVAQLASDEICSTPGDVVTATRLMEQVQEEFGHICACQSFLLERDALGIRPSYVNLYARLMRRVGRRRRRFLPLAVATVMCTAVEVAAFKQLSETAVGHDFCALLKRLYSEEHDHFGLVSRVVALRSGERASRLERFYTNLMTTAIILITALFWWPVRMRDYEAVGLDVDLFGRDVITLLSSPLETLQVASFPQLRRSVAFALRRRNLTTLQIETDPKNG